MEILLFSHLELINCSFKSFDCSRWQYQPVVRQIIRTTKSFHCSHWQYQHDEHFCFKPPWLLIMKWFISWSSQCFRHKPPWLYIEQIIYWTSHTIPLSRLLSEWWNRMRNPTKQTVIYKASFAPSAGQLRVLLLLLLLQMAHSLDVHTCSLLDAVFTCLLVILCWRPHVVVIPVAVVAVLLLYGWAAHCAYCG